MSRAGYNDYDDDGDHPEWGLIRWRGAVTSAIRGKRGQAFLRELLAALDDLPNKRLISEELALDGEVCAIGAVGLVRGVDLSKIDPYDYDAIAATFGIAPALAREIEYTNDETAYKPTPERRFELVRAWVVEQLTPIAPERHVGWSWG